MRRSRRQRQRQARSRRILVIAVLVILALVGAWLYMRGRHAEPATGATGVAPAVTSVITIPVPASAPATDVAPATTVQPAPATTTVPLGSVESPEAREASWLASRKEAIRIQGELRAKQNAEKAAKASPSNDIRCVDGQRMKRVQNGWVQDGTC
ncbi:hypothetical protein LYSHEL_15130 [Lysobacter helvus]|uniref:Uncharacterized protein n=2 Tax=Lysobacteraceae TaxID=32033 RepID=A0ABM7Q571_9GAMM|nr:hypothetical protein LYSCAS_15130 [Lysobacter caseinilyticus]BCT95642.1 hypothetical protein LYSHEL_15130 [Lysobacter helvus]